MFSSKLKRRGKKIVAYIFLVGMCFWWLPFSLPKSSSHQQASEKDLGDTVTKLLGHVADHHELHFGSVHVPLPIILYKKGEGWSCFSSKHLCAHSEGKSSPVYQGFQRNKSGIVIAQDGVKVYDFSITKNVLTMIFSALLMLLLFISLAIYTRKKGNQNEPPKGLWVVPLFFVLFVRKIAQRNIGKKHYARFTPYLLTLFFYILFNNLLGLLPEGANVTGNLSVTLTLGFFTLLITNWNGSRHYWRHMFCPSGVPWIMYPLVALIELLGAVMRPAVLGIRLFANMFAGHLVLLGILGLIFILQSIFVAIIAVPLTVAMVLFKIFTSFMQAYVFTLLSAISFGAAVKEH